tara:strand:- start:494 stop:718 length:225 start_codon:yes stop_codon:yes gene_type:complete
MNKKTDILVAYIAYLTEKLDNVQAFGDDVRVAEVENEMQIAVEELRQEQKMEAIEKNHREQWHQERALRRKDFL